MSSLVDVVHSVSSLYSLVPMALSATRLAVHAAFMPSSACNFNPECHHYLCLYGYFGCHLCCQCPVREGLDSAALPSTDGVLRSTCTKFNIWVLQITAWAVQGGPCASSWKLFFGSLLQCRRANLTCLHNNANNNNKTKENNNNNVINKS